MIVLLCVGLYGRDYAAHGRTKMIWVALLLVGRSAFPWLMLSHTAWTSKESGAAAAVLVSTAICRYGGRSCRRVLAAVWTAVVGRLGWLRRVVNPNSTSEICLFYFLFFMFVCVFK